MRREPAIRIFSAELNSSKQILKKEGEKEPTYILTPLGAKVRRVFIVGLLTDVSEQNENYTSAKLSDGTFNFYLKSFSFQEPVRKKLQELSTPGESNLPKLIYVIGKVSVFNPDPEKFFISIIPEKIGEINKNVRDYWVLNTAKAMKVRIDAMAEAKKMKDPTTQMLKELGYPGSLAENTIIALNLYKDLDIEYYYNLLETALKSMVIEYQPETVEYPVIEEEETSKDIEYENKILELIEKLDFEGKGAKYEDLIETCEKEKISSEKLDEILEILEHGGLTYEPTFGYIKKV